jgi:hypothetical protein
VGSMMLTRPKRLLASVVATALACASIAAPSASGQGPINQDGLVNVVVGDVTILEDVNVAVGANVAAQLCGIQVGPLALAVLGQAVAVDASGRDRTICEVNGQDVTITQN